MLQEAAPVTAKPTSFGDLPVETILNVLMSVPDLDSLVNASMSCRQWNVIVRRFESQVSKAVLSNELGGLSALPAGAIEALRIPLNSDNNIATDLFKLRSFILPKVAGPHPFADEYDALWMHARFAMEIQQAMGVSTVQSEDEFDPIRGPYSIKTAREVMQVHRAHTRLADMHFKSSDAEAPGSQPIQPTSREPFETALWHFEAFCRLFGGHRWYTRWRDSVCFKIIIHAYWQSRTRAEIESIREVHTFLSKLVSATVPGSKVIEGVCPHGDISQCEPCRVLAEVRHRKVDSRFERTVEGAISSGLVGILERMSRNSSPCPHEHPFFLNSFLHEKDL